MGRVYEGIFKVFVNGNKSIEFERVYNNNAGRYIQFICDDGRPLYVNVDTGIKKSQIDDNGRIISSFNVMHR